MCDRKRVKSDPKRDEFVMSEAAAEAFKFLNAGTWLHYRGQGDTPTAARDRAARAAGVTSAQAERVWKRWRAMKTVNGDVYRRLRNKYEHICSMVEDAADAVEAKRIAIEEPHEADKSRKAAGGRGGEAAGGDVSSAPEARP